MISSVALDVILEELHSRHDQQVSLRVSKQRRRSLKDHKMAGESPVDRDSLRPVPC